MELQVISIVVKTFFSSEENILLDHIYFTFIFN